MLKILSKQKNYPPLAAVIALVVSLLFTVITPHEWVDTPQAQAYISLLSQYIPAMNELRGLLPPEHAYIALTGAAIWGLLPLYFLMSLSIPILDKNFVMATNQYVVLLNLKNKKICMSFLALFFMGAIFFDFSFFTVWGPHYHYGFGSWMNMISLNPLTQIITWTFMGIAEFLFSWVVVGVFVIIKCKLEGVLNGK